MAKIALQGNDAGTGTLTLQAPVTNLNRNLVLPDVDGTLSTAEQVKLPIGSFMWFTGTVAPEAFVVADGELRSRAAFPDLWAFAQSSGNISVDDASWTFGQYSPGDGSTTFRVPKVDDRFIRGKSATRAVGLVEEDAVGPIPINSAANNTTGGNGEYYRPTDSGGGDLEYIGTANETRPKALTMLPCIKAYDVISDPSVLNAVEVVNEISRLESEKLRKDENINLGVSVPASGTAVDFVGIPEGVKRVTVMFDMVSLSGSSSILVQVGGDSIINSSYYSTGGAFADSAQRVIGNNTGFVIYMGDSPRNFAGSMVINKVAESYCASYSGRYASDAVCNGGGSLWFNDHINKVRITTVNGTDQFDNGSINISWEF